MTTDYAWVDWQLCRRVVDDQNNATWATIGKEASARLLRLALMELGEDTGALKDLRFTHPAYDRALTLLSLFNNWTEIEQPCEDDPTEPL